MQKGDQDFMPGETLKRVLYIDDDPDIRTVARMALEMVGGLEVEDLGDGREAVTAARRFAPDLVLLDVMMPNIDGPGVLANLRAEADTASIPIVFMTAKAQAHEVSRYRDIGALDVVSKPFDPMSLADTVRAIWAKRHD